MATVPFDRFRRPEYTGENRCVPCTAVNLAIAVVAAGGIAVAGSSFLGIVPGGLVGGVAFLSFAAAIYLRGYLVPGTPWFTRTYFPDWLLRWFEKEPAAPGGSDGEIDAEALLKRAGAVTECEGEDDVCLTDEFRAAWHERVVDLRERDATRADLADILDVDPDRLSFETHGDAFVAYLDDRRASQWESHAAFLADMAGARELRERYDAWPDIDVQERGKILNGLRIFLERCPACDGPVSIDQEVVESCCRSIDVVAVTCRDCGARVFEAEQP